jgi:hypothetical protein
VEKVTIHITAQEGFRASEIVADLRNAAEILFHPLRCVGYWDGPSRDHLCPEAMRHAACPHQLSPKESGYIPYTQTVEDELRGFLEVTFPHADVSVFLG